MILVAFATAANAQDDYLLSPQKFKTTVDKEPKNVVIVDVRTPGEFNEGRIANSINIDVNSTDFADSISNLDKSKVYFLYCKGGVRSSRARDMMKEAGFKYIFELDGGIMNWLDAEFPVVVEEKNH